MEWRKITILIGAVVFLIGIMTVMLMVRKDSTKVVVYATGSTKEDFIRNCGTCHGKDGNGTTLAKGLRGKSLDYEYVKKVIQTGSTVMPGFHFIHDSLLTNLANYVHNMK